MLDSMCCKLGLLVGLVLIGCVAGPDEGVASEPVDESPLAPAAVDRWTPRNDEPTVCAWRGAVFSLADFEAVPTPDRRDICVSFAQCAWDVEAGDEPRIFIHGSFSTPSPLPFTPAALGQSRCLPNTVHRVDDGWLLGYD
jgi:hypothetical protein